MSLEIWSRLKWIPRPSVALDAMESRYSFSNGYDVHLIYLKSTEQTRGYQLSVLKDGWVLGKPVQHADQYVINELLKQVQSGAVFKHRDKNVLLEQMLSAESSIGKDPEKIVRDFERDLPVYEQFAKHPLKTLDNLEKIHEKDGI